MTCGSSFEGNHCVTNVLREIAEAQKSLALANVTQVANRLFLICLDHVKKAAISIQYPFCSIVVIVNRSKVMELNQKN